MCQCNDMYLIAVLDSSEWMELKELQENEKQVTPRQIETLKDRRPVPDPFEALQKVRFISCFFFVFFFFFKPLRCPLSAARGLYISGYGAVVIVIIVEGVVWFCDGSRDIQCTQL